MMRPGKSTLHFWAMLILLLPAQAQNKYELSWSRDGWILGANIGVAISASAIDDAVPPLTQVELAGLSKNDILGIDRWNAGTYSKASALASDVSVGIVIAAPGLLLLDDESRMEWREISAMYLQTLAFAVFLPSYAKGGVQRIRPYAYSADAPQDLKQSAETRRSFFSGHTTIAFASAVFAGTVYSEFHPNSSSSTTVWIVAMSAASVVGLFRITAGAHYLTDVLAGAAVGSAVGYLVPQLHKAENSSQGMNITPTTSGMRIGFAVGF